MRFNFAWSEGSATTEVCSLFLRLRALDVRMCLANACCRTTFPVPVFLNRLDAPLWVFNLGMKYSGNLNSNTTGCLWLQRANYQEKSRLALCHDSQKRRPPKQ